MQESPHKTGLCFGRPVHHDRLQLENWRTCRKCVGQTATRQQARKPQIPTRDHPTIRSKNGVFFLNLFFKRPYLRKRGTGRGRDGRTDRPGRLAVHPKSSSGSSHFFTKMREDEQKNGEYSGHFGTRADFYPPGRPTRSAEAAQSTPPRVLPRQHARSGVGGG